MISDQLIARSLTWRYLIALILVAMLATAAWLSLHLVISEQESNAAIVNISGRQRMLSQRTALFSSLLASARPDQRAEIRQKLRDAAALMKRSHRGLLHGDAELGLPPTMSETVRAMYHELPLELNAQVEGYLASVDALLQVPDEQLSPDHPHLQAIIAASPVRLVASLDQAVTQYQLEGEAAVKRLLRAETIVWLLTLLLLAIEANFIFRPFANQIRIVIGKLQAVTETLRQSKEELELRVRERTAELDRIAHYDPLTGIPNRRQLADNMSQAIARARRQGRSLAVCYLDLDGFKPINDQYGHAAGDAILVEIANRLKQVLRVEDTLARLGGDEFVLILADLNQKDEIVTVLERVLTAVNSEVHLGNQVTVRISASIGVTLFPDDAADPDTLLRHADQAMYLAKESGKNRYQLFDPEHDRQVQSHRDEVLRLTEALERGEFRLHYQPKVDLVSGHVFGAEALIRWQHPERGLLPPGEFLHHLNGTELELAVGEWVIETVLEQIERWRALGLELTVSANVSADHLLKSDFAERLGLMLERHPQSPPGRLELEILETAALADVEQAVNTLNRCRQLGIGFALDDFGTGYSSLAYFRSLPVEMLKIDQSFVRHMLEDPDDLGLVEGVIRLARAFNREVIAEGVETLEHGALLLHLGCRFAQGYGIARPMPAEQLADWATRWQHEAAWQGLGNRFTDDHDITLTVAERNHRRWLAHIISYIENPVQNAPTTLDSTHCRFGQWYRGSGMARYGEYSEFESIGLLHESLHIIAIGLVALARDGQTEAARADLPVLRTTGEKLIAQIEKLIERVSTH
ncbi:MAG: EAL domain-containing protein [Pseudomonadota bacterium]